MDLLAALEARSGVVCVVGAGGKKTTLYTLAEHATAAGLRTVVTATVRIPLFDAQVARVVTTTEPVAAIESSEDWPLGVVPGREGEHRYGGYDPAVVDELGALDGVDLVLVKADGARTREFKAPGDHEPQLPDGAGVVCPIASVQAVGRPLDAETVHRPERVGAIADLEPGDRIGPSAIATVLASPDGGLKGVPSGATAVPILNKVDDADAAELGREIATAIHRQTDVPRVVLTSMIGDRPVVDVVT